jgi:hypothetical protein
MTTPVPMPTGQTTYQHGATYAADGTTRLTASSAASLVSAAPNADPPLVVSTRIYESRVPDGTVYPANELVILFDAGQIVKTSKWNAAFPLAAVVALSPATGPHTGGGTVVTMTGQNFTPGTTVTVGGVAATSIVITAPNLMTFTTPAASGAGAANVMVTNDGGALTLTGAFLYT